MEVIKTEKRMKEVEVTIERYTLCDKCNNKIERESSFDVFECKLEQRTGEHYPEGGSGEKDKMDLCQKCAKDCIKLLTDNGYRISHSEWDT